MRHALSIGAILIFNALPIVGVVFLGWDTQTALTLLCADLMILTMLGLANAFTNLAPGAHPKLAKIFCASILVLMTGAALAMTADQLQAHMDLGMALEQTQLGVPLLLFALSRLAQYAFAVALSPRPWKTGLLVHPLFVLALLLWIWRPGDPWTYVLLFALCVIKLVAETVEHFEALKTDHEAAWLTRVTDRLRG